MSVVNAIPLLLGDEGYNISRSVRLRSSASAYFGRSFTVAGTNATKRTYSMWVKRGQLGAAAQQLMGCYYSGGPVHQVYLSNDQIVASTFYSGAFQNITTTAVLRDPSAWYHIVYSIDTTQATAANRQTIYVNGVSLAYTGTNVPQNSSLPDLTNGNSMNIMAQGGGISPTNYFDGYLTEVNVIDGQALTPSSFGETDTITGVWKPKKYAGTYGTNGFYLNFSDNSSNTATTIGKDNSGNGNNWTPNNISVTAGSTYDSMIDVPTLWADGGNGRGNYCVMNPLINTAGYVTIAQGNLYASIGAADKIAHATMQLPSTGKWYWEYTATSAGSQSAQGVSNNAVTQSSGTGFSTANLRMYQINGQKTNGAASAAYGASFTTNDVIGVAVDMDAGTIDFYKNNTSQGTAYSDLAGGTWFPATYINNANGHFNFGQRPFAYTPPTGFKALNTQNLPAPTILKGNKYFDATLYSGNNSTQSIVNSGAMQPDLVWIKSRNIGGANHVLTDSVRGVNKFLLSNLTDAEYNIANTLTAFNSNGFSLGNTAYDFNISGNNYVGWQWKANGSPVSNTSGSITSQVSAGTSQGFSVVTYTGNGVNATVGHGLGVTPRMIIFKARTATSGWTTYFHTLGAGNFLSLNSTAGSTASIYPFNNTAPTSSVFSIGVTGNGTNNTGATYVAYCFSEVAGFSRFGSFVGNGSADGPFIFTGFRPRFVLVKGSTNITEWYVWDSARNQYNVTNLSLNPNQSAAEYSAGSLLLDLTANGFKVRDSVGSWNTSGQTYIFAAFAESPFKNSLAR
jgi:hypothetical protein